MQTETLTMFRETITLENEKIWIRPFCLFFDLSVQNQHRKLRNDPILQKLWIKKSNVFNKNQNQYSNPVHYDVQNLHQNGEKTENNLKLVEKNKPVFGEIQKSGRIYLTKAGFIRWIQLINPNTVRPELRQKFIEYQSMVLDYLYGSADYHAEARRNYTRLQKLENLQSKIAAEIRRERQIMHNQLSSRYLQTSISFPERKELNGN